MFHSVLLVVSMPAEDDYKDQQRWKGCATNLKDRASKNKGIQILGENVVLISLQNGLDLLSEVVRKDILDLPYKYTIFGETIEWYEASKII